MNAAPFAAGADPAPLAALHAACFPEAWDAAALKSLLAGPGVFAFTADHRGAMAGFVLARAVAGDGRRGHG